MPWSIKEIEAEAAEAAQAATDTAGEYTATVMRLVEIGEQPSIKNYSIMKNAVQLVNTFGATILQPKIANTIRLGVRVGVLLAKKPK
jgi:hypothetical protein